MLYKEIMPGERLRHYIKCYYTFESSSDAGIDDTVFPGGHMEIIFNLGQGAWMSSVNDTFRTTPPIELWGKITQPLAVRATGKHYMLGIKFYPHSAAYFLDAGIHEFNNRVLDCRDLLGEPVRILHDRLRETMKLSNRIALVEQFLLDRLAASTGSMGNIAMVGRIIQEIQQTENPDKFTNIASRFNISSRYLNKLFLQYTGVTPKLYQKISRFQRSLKLITDNRSSLTSIAYDCGYFDQSHFIRDFKLFTNQTPSAYSPEEYPVAQVISSN